MHAPGKLTRAIYALSLLIIVAPFCVSKFHYALILFKQMIGGNTNIINPFIALCDMLVSLVIAAIVLYRIYAIIRGRVTLALNDEYPMVSFGYTIGLLFMYIGVIIVFSGIVINFSVEGATYLVRFIVRHFVFLIMAGVIVFEFARLKSFEFNLVKE